MTPIKPVVVKVCDSLDSPVGIGRHRALDDDDLPRVEPSGYGPCVRDHLGRTADMRTPALTPTRMTPHSSAGHLMATRSLIPLYIHTTEGFVGDDGTRLPIVMSNQV